MNRLLLILSVALLVSCEKDVKVPDFEFESYVVVNSLITPDSLWKVNLNYSQSSLETGDAEPLNDAQVIISVINTQEDDQEIVQDFMLDNNGNGEYTFGSQPSGGKTYQMRIISDKGVTTAHTYVPKDLEIDSSNINTIISEDSRTFEIEIVIDEDPNHDNYYAWDIVLDETNVIASQDPNEHEITGLNNPDDLLVEQPLSFRNEGLAQAKPIFSDTDETNGNTTTTVTGQLDQEGFGTSKGSIVNGDINIVNTRVKKTYTLKVWSVSQDFYQYLITRSDNPATSDTNFNNPYTNVENGRGIFAGYNLWEIPITF